MATNPFQPYGINYTPSTLVHSRKRLSVDDLPVHGIDFVRLQWNDFTNLTRFRVVPFSSFRALLKAPRPGIGITKACLGIVNTTLAEGFPTRGEYVFVPDLDTLTICAYAPGHASVMGWFQEKQPAPGSQSLDVALCPRTLLNRIERDAKAASVEFLVGIETEFILLSSTDPIQPVSYAPWSSSAKLVSGSAPSTILEEISRVLQQAGIEVLMYHAEAGPGQYEIVTGPLPPLRAADALVVTRETVYNIAAKHGMRATLAPRIFSDAYGSASQVNISVHHSGSTSQKTSQLDTAMTPMQRSFLQSLLEHLPSLAAITLPTPHSYMRVQDGIRSGGTYACWGYDNRESLVRVAGSTGNHRFEARSVDGTASPYLTLAALLGAGMRGIYERKELVIEECEGMAAALTEEERRRKGITGRLPKNLKLAREGLASDVIVANILGAEFVQSYIAVNTLLEKSLSGGTPQEEMKTMVEIY